MKTDLGPGIAFDLSKTNTGVAIFDAVGAPVTLREKSYTKFRYFGHVLINFRRDVYRLLGAHEPIWCAYEEVMPVNKLHAEIHFGMVGMLAAACASRGIPLFGVNTGAMRKLILGNGRASKGETVEAMQARYPDLHVPSHDAADAMLVGLYVVERAQVSDEDPRD